MNLAAMIALALAVSPADSQRAAKLGHRSIIEYNASDFAKALEDAKAAYELDPRPALLFNLGQCYRALGNYSEARFSYRAYLREQPDAPNQATVVDLIKQMEAKLQAQAPPPPPAAPPPKPEPAPPTLVLAPAAPPEAQAPSPWAETTATQAPQGHSHALSIGLGVGALIGAGVSIWGWAQVWSYQSLQGQSKTSPGTVQPSVALSSQSSAQTGQIVGIAAAIVAAGLGTGAIFTW